jgi:hypothetical protein
MLLNKRDTPTRGQNMHVSRDAMNVCTAGSSHCDASGTDDSHKITALDWRAEWLVRHDLLAVDALLDLPQTVRIVGSARKKKKKKKKKRSKHRASTATARMSY